ncbi:MAG: MerR family transcriptional regulator [Chthonomonas sp.]|nr:MerR family transcriptional regulator [Chthonomonas sp.]
MPLTKLADQQNFAPFHIDDLLESANRVLSMAGLREVQRRTLRFYIHRGIVPKPIGSPKFARYLYSHLLRLVGARSAQDQGYKLEQIRAEFDQCANEEELALVVSRYLDARPTKRRQLVVAEEVAAYGDRKIVLSPGISLSILSDKPVNEQLEKALTEINKMLGK